ncbi:MAG: hypothetical protein GY771_03490 [bacterium]|nr:hypothetical protein [bacterium]
MYTFEFTGKRTRSGRSISKSLKGTKRRFRPNLHRKVV